MSIAAHDLNEAIVLGHQRPIVDATRIWLAKACLAPLSEKPHGGGHMLKPVNFMLIGHAVRSAINHYRRLIQSLLDLIGRLHTQLFEVTHRLRRYDQFRSTTDQIFDLGAVAEQRTVFMEGHLIELKLLT